MPREAAPLKVIRATKLVYRIYQRSYVLRRRVLRNPMAEIEHVPVASPERGQCLCRLAANHIDRGGEHGGIQIALQRDAGADARTRACEIDGPVEPERITARCRDAFRRRTRL